MLSARAAALMRASAIKASASQLAMDTPSPSSFAQDLRAARALADPNEQAKRLTDLSLRPLSFLETIQLDGAYGRATSAAAPTLPRVRIALLGSSTLDHLLPAIRVAGLKRGVHIDVHTGSFGQYRQDLLQPAESLRTFEPEVIVLSLTAREAIAGIHLGASLDETEQAIARWVADLREVWSQARVRFGTTLIQQTFLDVSEPIFGDLDRLVPGSPTRLVSRLNDRLAEVAAQDHVLLLDVARASARDGIDAWFDVTRWYQGKIEIAPQSALRFGDMLARIIGSQRGLSKKCLVLDLDNTLWGGVIGDDGIDGIVLGDGSALGEAHLALQRYAKLLNQRGVILAVCSKNNTAIAEAVFRDHPEMALRRSDIAAFVANWDDKASNLRTIASQLNIGLDSLVFVDDNPAERARVRESLPMVAVPELPDDPAHYVRCLAGAGYFEATSFTADDRQRAEQYATNADRDSLRSTAQSVDDFLRNLEMTLAFGEVRAVDMARVAQLVNKTNQFNPTTRRCAHEELAANIALPGSIALQFRLIDRFGDNGLISSMLLRRDPSRPEVADVDFWVMSCRVFGRQVEFEAMTVAVEAARRHGVRVIRASYLPSAKNGVVAKLYENLGFERTSSRSEVEGSSDWELLVSDYVPRTTFIRQEAQA